jgi:hypothetical protein
VGEGYICWIINKFFERGKGKNRKRKSKEPLLMNEKTLEPESRYSKYDLDGDGVVTDEELEMDAKMMRLENEDKK